MNKDFWNERYSEEGFAYGQSPNDFLKSNIHLIKPKGEVLCIAEGEGRNAIFLAEMGFKVTAVDFSEVGMSKLKAWAKEKNLNLITQVADLNDYDFGKNKWDAIISIFSHLPEILRAKVNQNIKNSLKSNGLIILEAYSLGQLALNSGGPKDKNLLISKEIVLSDFFDLSQEYLLELTRNISEGKYHNGVSAVIQFIGKKK